MVLFHMSVELKLIQTFGMSLSSVCLSVQICNCVLSGFTEI